MAEMTPGRWQRLEPLLDHALALDECERAQWLAELGGSTPDVIDEVTALLASDVEADRRGFLAGSPLANVPLPTLEGLALGAYTLVRPLGHGGMGSVWLANRTDGRFEGRSAIKLLNLALLTTPGQERFRLEGSALARLTHPGIARLLDAGVGAGGQPYLVLEYVDGQRIDSYVAERGLDAEACVRLFLGVLDAVGHAHANLVVHRDLKPSNILVTAEGMTKLLDFGIAKLLDADPSRGGVTMEGARAFTPEFAAPEQVSGDAVTTATDVYSLGVLLSMLLSDRAGARVTRGSQVRDAERRPLGLGDLDTVLMTACRVVPSERYQSVTAFADDLRRWLRHEPVSARADALSYRAAKFLRRNRIAAVTAGAVALLTAIYTVSVRRDRERVRGALAEATTSAQRAEQVADFAVGLFDAGVRSAPFTDTVSARELLARGVVEARELSARPLVRAQMLDVLGRIHAARGEFAEGRRLLTEALTVRRQSLGERHPDVATSMLNVASVMYDLDGPASALPLLGDALAIRQDHYGREDGRTNEARYLLAKAQHASGNRVGARALFDEWVTVMRREPPRVTPARADQLGALASIYKYGGRFAEAERLSREVLAMRIALHGPQHHAVAVAHFQLGSTLDDAGRHEEAGAALRTAVSLLRASYPDGHPELANGLRNLGIHLERTAQWAEAERTWREAEAMYRRFVGADALATANATAHVGRSLSVQGQHDEAVIVLRTLIRGNPSLAPGTNPIALRTQLFLGDALLGRGDFAEAERVLLACYRAWTGGSPLFDADRRMTARALVRLYEAINRPEEAARYRAKAGG